MPLHETHQFGQTPRRVTQKNHVILEDKDALSTTFKPPLHAAQVRLVDALLRVGGMLLHHNKLYPVCHADTGKLRSGFHAAIFPVHQGDAVNLVKKGPIPSRFGTGAVLLFLAACAGKTVFARMRAHRCV